MIVEKLNAATRKTPKAPFRPISVYTLALDAFFEHLGPSTGIPPFETLSPKCSFMQKLFLDGVGALRMLPIRLQGRKDIGLVPHPDWDQPNRY